MKIMIATLFLLAGLTVAAEDLTERPGAVWQTQSYWQDKDIQQDYTFTPNPDDKRFGDSSVRVTMAVGEQKPRDLIELRLALKEDLDLSAAEALGLSIKLVKGEGIKPRDVFLADPTWNKLTIAAWPKDLKLVPGMDWQEVVLDLTTARVLDKQDAGPNPTYDRKNVRTICLNFNLPTGAVDAELLVDGLRVVALPPPDVRRTQADDGSWTFTTDHYQVTIGAHGYPLSIRAGDTEFLAAKTLGDATYGAVAFLGNNGTKPVAPLPTVTPFGREGLKAVGPEVQLEYHFSKTTFDIYLQHTLTPGGGYLYLLPAADVVAVLDGRTDRASLPGTAGAQIGARLVTRSGGVLACQQYVEGYSRICTQQLPDQTWACALLGWGAGRNRFTLRPVAKPAAPDALGLTIACASPDFLLPGGQPVRFDLKATNYAADPVSGTATFEIRDYLTRKPVAARRTPFTTDPGEAFVIPTDVPLAAPGPYRAAIIVADPAGNSREVECIFTYDFPNYSPPSTRPDDFHAFWQHALDDLAKVPLDAHLVPAPEVSDDQSDAFRVDLATLNGRRIYGWYWRPKKPGRYPAFLELPSSGVYTRQAAHVSHGPDRVGMWIAIHGLPVDVAGIDRSADPAAWNYWTYGIDSPETSMWRVIGASLVRAVDFLASRDEVDADRIACGGGSQGGGLTMILAGLDRRIAFAAPAHSGLARLDWTVKYKPGFWPFDMSAKPAGQTEEQFLRTLAYFDTANFTPDITCPIFAEVSLLDTVTAGGNQICALSHVKPGLLELICSPWTSHASSPRTAPLRGQAIARWLAGENPIRNPIKPVQ